MDKYRILIADDEPIERQVVNKKIMEFFPDQVSVTIAENGLQAVELFEENNCQIAILDIEMPGMNGLEAASVIRQRHEFASIIFLTAFDEFSYAKKAIEVKALDYLLKPGADKDLINVIEEAMRLCDKNKSEESMSGNGGTSFASSVNNSDLDNGLSDEAMDLSEANRIVKRVRSYIDDNYREDIALQDIAGAFGYSDVYFCKLFKQNFGMNFITYLNEYRMERAKELLADPMINIKDISLKAGYRDANYFTRVFKRTMGMTPSEYRSGVLGE